MHFPVICHGQKFFPRGGRGWSTTELGMKRLRQADRIMPNGINLAYRRFLEDSPVLPIVASWRDTGSGFMSDKVYVVQTNTKVIERCILMTTDPGDLVFDPTCGSGTTAYVAEQWGRRWITIDTSRVALALARARIMGARYPYYLLSDSRAGQLKEAEIASRAPADSPTYNDIRQGFVYERVPHITLKSIANNAEIDVIWEKWQETLEPLRAELNTLLNRAWEEWEIPREPGDPWSATTVPAWKKFHAARTNEAKSAALRALNQELGRDYTLDGVPDRPLDPWESHSTDLHRRWWEQRIARQEEIDASIAAKADYEYLYDKPYENKKVVRVAGPFTVESLSPHRVLGVGEDDEFIDIRKEDSTAYGAKQSFPQMILENLKTRRCATGAQRGLDCLHRPHPVARRAGLRRRPLPRRQSREAGRYLYRFRVWHRAARRSCRRRP